MVILNYEFLILNEIQRNSKLNIVFAAAPFISHVASAVSATQKRNACKKNINMSPEKRHGLPFNIALYNCSNPKFTIQH